MGNSFWKTPLKPVPINKQSSRGISETVPTQFPSTLDTPSILRIETIKNCELLEKSLKKKVVYGAPPAMPQELLTRKITTDLIGILEKGFNFDGECGRELTTLLVANIKVIRKKRIFPQEFFESVHDSLKKYLIVSALDSVFKDLGVIIREPENRPKKDDGSSRIKILPLIQNVKRKEKRLRTNDPLKHNYFENLKMLLNEEPD